MSLRIFLSTVSERSSAIARQPDSLRVWIDGELRKRTVECVYQELLIDSGVNTLIKLAQAIERNCEMVIHILDSDPGRVPDKDVVVELLKYCGETQLKRKVPHLFRDETERNAQLWSRLTYTQWEAWLGYFFDRDVILCTSGTTTEELIMQCPMSNWEHLGHLKQFVGYPNRFSTKDDLLTLLLSQIVKKLQLPSAEAAWPRHVFAQQSKIANREIEVQHLVNLLSHACPERILLVHGASSLGKTTLLEEYLRQIQCVPAITFSRIDLRGGRTLRDIQIKLAQDIEGVAVDTEFEQSLLRNGNQPTPASFLEYLSKNRRPIVLIFDTYDEVLPNVRNWIEKWLLPTMVQLQSICLVIAGITVPEPDPAWTNIALSRKLKAIQDPDDWIRWGQAQEGISISDEEIRELVEATEGNPAALRALIAPQDKAK